MPTSGAATLLNMGVLYDDQRQFYLNPYEMALLDPNLRPYLAFTTGVRKIVTVPDLDYRMFQYAESWENPNMQVNAAAVALVAGTESNSIAVDNFEGIVPTTGLMVEIWNSTKKTKKAVGVITTVVDETHVKIKPLYVNPAAATTADDDWMFMISHAAAEMSGSPETFFEDIEVVYNSISTLKTPVMLSNDLLATKNLRGFSSRLKFERTQKRALHLMKANKTLLYSRRVAGLKVDPKDGTAGAHITDPATGNKIRSTNGFIPIMEDYNDGDRIITQPRGSYSWGRFVDDMKKLYRNTNGEGVLYGFCGDDYFAWINQLVEDRSIMGHARVRLGDVKTSNKFKFKVNQLSHPWGELILVRDKSLTRSSGGVYSNYCLVNDPGHIMRTRFRKSMYETNLLAPGIDGKKEQWFEQIGLGLTQPDKHGILIAA